MDWCGHPGQYTAPQLYQMMSDALNKTGRPILFSICEWGLYNPWEWAPPMANMWRSGPDHIPLWWSPDTGQDPGTAGGTSQIIQHFAGLSKYAAPGQWNDPDYLLPGYFWEFEVESVTEFSFWSLFAAPLIVATDVRDLSDKQVILNKEVIDIDQDKLGIQGDLRVNNTDGGQIWTRPLSNNSWAAVLYNSNFLLGDASFALNFTADIFPGWPSTISKASVRDVWAHQDMGVFSQYIVSSVEPHASVMLKVTPVSS